MSNEKVTKEESVPVEGFVYVPVSALQKPEKERWYDVKDKLPDYDEQVIWLLEDGNMVVEDLDKDGNPWLLGGEINGFTIPKVTHWRVLPQRPDEDYKMTAFEEQVINLLGMTHKPNVIELTNYVTSLVIENEALKDEYSSCQTIIEGLEKQIELLTKEQTLELGDTTKSNSSNEVGDKIDWEGLEKEFKKPFERYFLDKENKIEIINWLKTNLQDYIKYNNVK